ncbi:cupin domain-containing protein [Luedemannella helvata]|uniref:Cupin domain-containing protein n=1 Tax=Luedemannella helvata TaxID=349315 RepID=A0ABP4WLL0_9ACTN
MGTDYIAALGLEPHPEGGWYRRTWASPVTFVPPGYGGARAAATAIYFLLRPGEVSRWHVVRSAELWLWHAGGPLALTLGDALPVARSEIILGPHVGAGQQPQGIVPGGVWQTATPRGDQPTLVTCVVAPGFDFADWTMTPPA